MRAVVVDDEWVVRAGLGVVLADLGTTVAAASASTAVLGTDGVDLVVIGRVQGRDQRAAVDRARRVHPGAMIVALIDWLPSLEILPLFSAGADVVGDRRAAARELRDCVTGGSGQRVGPGLLDVMVQSDGSAQAPLTDLETSALTLIADGSSAADLQAVLRCDAAALPVLLDGLRDKLDDEPLLDVT